MLEKWKKALNNRNYAEALLTDVSKSFDSINHGLLVSALEANRFSYSVLSLMSSYLSARKQRTKGNNSFSNWADIISKIPQGSILGPLLFNLYINDIFYFVKESNVTNYADDTTRYNTEVLDHFLTTYKWTLSILLNWFENNYFKLNADKYKLLVTTQCIC